MPGTIYQLKGMIQATEQIKLPNLFLLEILIGLEKTQNKARFEVHTKDAMRIKVPLSGRREKGKLIDPRPFESKTYEPPYIKAFLVAEADRYLTQQFGQTIYGDGEANAKKQLAKEIVELKTIASRTRLWMLSELLFKGVLPVQDGEEGVSFGEHNSEVLSGADKWSDPACDIIGYLRMKKQEVHQKTGIAIDALVVNPDVVSYITDNPKIVDKLKSAQSSLINIDPKSLGNGAVFVGYIPELNLEIYSYIDWVSEDGKTETPLIPDGTIAGFKKKSFTCHYGAMSLRPKANEDAVLFIAKEVVRKMPGAGEDDEIQLHSAPFIVPQDAQGWFVAKVI